MEERVVYHSNPLVGLVYLVTGIIAILLALRFVFLMFNVAAIPVVNFIYSTTNIFVQPFYGLFGHTFISGTPRIEIESLIAIIVVSIIGSVIAAILRALN